MLSFYLTLEASYLCLDLCCELLPETIAGQWGNKGYW